MNKINFNLLPNTLISQEVPNEMASLIIQYLDNSTLFKMSLVSKAWKELLDSSKFRIGMSFYRRIWQEWPKCAEESNYLQNMEEIFLERFHFTYLDTICHDLKFSIPVFAHNILNIRKYANPEGETAYNYYSRGTFWINIIREAQNDKEKYYALRELNLIVAAQDQMSELKTNLFDSLTQWPEVEEDRQEQTEDKKLRFEILKELFSPIEIQHLILNYSEPDELLYTAVRCRLFDILDVYLKNNLDIILQMASPLLRQAAYWGHFDILQQFLNHSPSLACHNPLEETEETALHALCALDEAEIVGAKWKQWQILVKQLIQQGCPLDKCDKEGRTPYHKALTCENQRFAKFILFIPFYQAIKIKDIKFLQSNLIKNSSSKRLVLKLTDYFMKTLNTTQLDILDNDELRNKQNSDILFLLLETRPTLLKEFDFKIDLFHYPWMLPIFIYFIQKQDSFAQQSDLLNVFEAVLHTPFIFLKNLVINN